MRDLLGVLRGAGAVLRLAGQWKWGARLGAVATLCAVLYGLTFGRAHGYDGDGSGVVIAPGPDRSVGPDPFGLPGPVGWLVIAWAVVLGVGVAFCAYLDRDGDGDGHGYRDGRSGVRASLVVRTRVGLWVNRHPVLRRALDRSGGVDAARRHRVRRLRGRVPHHGVGLR